MGRRSFITTAALVAGLALGLVLSPTARSYVASAQTPSPSASASASASNKATGNTLFNSFLDKLAAALGIQRSELDTAITNAGNSTVDEALANGTLSQQQADALRSRIQGGNFGFFGGRGGRGGPEGGLRLPGVKDAMINAAATTLNLSVDELRTQLRSGQTLAQIAQAQGTTEQAVTDAALAAAKTQLDQAVANGTVTQAQADAIYAELQARGTQLLQRGGRGGGHHGHDDFGTPSAPAASPSPSTGADA